MVTNNFFDTYFEEYKRLAFAPDVFPHLAALSALARARAMAGGKLMFAGNGASASLAEHGAVDLTKQGRVRAVTFHDPNLMTCFANDFGYDYWMAKAIEHYSDPEDAVVLISVSGESPSVVNAAQTAKDLGLPVVAFTGRKADNTLGQLADLHFYVASEAYNVVECIHGIWLTTAIDHLIGKSVYETRALASKGAAATRPVRF